MTLLPTDFESLGKVYSFSVPWIPPCIFGVFFLAFSGFGGLNQIMFRSRTGQGLWKVQCSCGEERHVGGLCLGKRMNAEQRQVPADSF